MVAGPWDTPLFVVWMTLPLLIISAASLLTWLRVDAIARSVEEVRRITVAATKAQIDTDQRVAAMGVRLISISDQQTAMLATLRRAYPVSANAPTHPGKNGLNTPILGSVEGYGRALAGQLEPPSSQSRLRHRSAGHDDESGDDPTGV